MKKGIGKEERWVRKEEKIMEERGSRVAREELLVAKGRLQVFLALWRKSLHERMPKRWRESIPIVGMVPTGVVKSNHRTCQVCCCN